MKITSPIMFLFLFCGVLWGQQETKTNYFFESEVLFWPEKTHVRPRFVFTNTFIISNSDVIAGVTNWRESNVTVIYEFLDAFNELISLDPQVEWERRLAEMIFPSDWYHFPVEERYLRWMRKSLRRHSPELLSSQELLSFSPKILLETQSDKRQKRSLDVRKETTPLTLRVEEWESEFVLSGRFVFRVGYGWSWKDPLFLQPVGSFQKGLDMAQNLRFNLNGKIGQRVNVSLSHQSDNPENTYSLQYKALDSDKGIVREVLLGNVAMQIPQKSSLISTEGIPQQGVGVLGRFQIDKLNWQSLLHLSGSMKGYKRFVGSGQYRSVSIRDTQYLKRMYFVLPDQDIDTGSVEILLQTNEIADRQIDGHYYKRLVFMQDYTVDHARGEIALKTSFSRELRLVIRYTRGGLGFSNPAGPIWQGTDDNTGETFLYLWREDEPFAPYMHYGVYSLGTRTFDPGRGFDVRVVYTANPSLPAPVQFHSSAYRIQVSAGLLWFSYKHPFPGYSNLYTNYADPPDAISLYTLVCSYYEPLTSFQLDYNVIPQSESIYLNGRKLASWEYILVSSTGELILNQISSLQENDVIEAYYEYKPFYGSGVQKFTWANRWDYTILPAWNMGGTLLGTMAQRGEEGARLPQTPSGMLLASVDNTLNIGSLLGWSPQNKWTIQMEAAASVYDPNTSGIAIIEDFENAGEIFQLSRSEYRWILAASLTNLPNMTISNRGKLIYRDYRQYQPDGGSSLIPYYQTPFAVYAYHDKPGPYMALGGHLPASEYPNIVQSVLVWDYDFSDGDWVGTAYPLANGLTVNMSEYDEVIFWAKIETDDDGNGLFSDNTSHELEMFLAVGGLGEDSDGDGVLDREHSVQDLGFPFHDPTNQTVIVTRVGIGRGNKGDGFIQSEDLNGNGQLDVSGNWVLLPSPGITSPSNTVLQGNGWRSYNIQIHQLSSDQKRALQQASAVALYLKKKNGTKGRVLIDGISFQKTKWQKLTLDGHLITSTPQWRTGILTTFTSAQYQKHRFYDPWSTDEKAKERYATFEQLHKMRSKTEVLQYEEKSLSLSYSLSNIPYDPVLGKGGMSAMVWQNFTSGLPIGSYETLAFYLFVPSSSEEGLEVKSGLDSWNNETFSFLIGSDTNNFHRWEIPLRDIQRDHWCKVSLSTKTLELSLGEAIYRPVQQSGSPYLQEIKLIGFGIKTDESEPFNRGTIWVNELHVSNDQAEVGWATVASTTLDWRRPLWVWNGWEITGPLLANARSEWRSEKFRSSLGTSSTLKNASTLLYSIDAHSSVLRMVDYRVYGSWLSQATRTNEAELPLESQFVFKKNNGGFTARYKSSAWIPEIFQSYSEETQWKRFFSSSREQQTIVQTASGKWTFREKLPWSRFFSHQIDIGYEHGSTFDSGEYLSIPETRLSNRTHTLSRNKIFSLSFIQTTKTLTLSGGYGKNQQKYRNYPLVGPLDEEGKIFRESGRIAERYIWIQRGLFEGFDWNDPFWQKDDESFSWGIQLDKPWPWIYMENKSFWSRSRTSFSYSPIGNLLSFQTTHGLTNQWAVNLYPRWLALDTLGVSLQRQTRLWYQFQKDPLSYAEIGSTVGGIYYLPPWQYNTTLHLVSARSNALVMVSTYTNLSGSQLAFEEAWRWEWILPRYDNFWDTLLPKRYRYSTSLISSRVDFGYTQVFSHSFGTLSEFFWGRFWTNHGFYQVNPLQLDLSLAWSETYLTKISSTTWTTTLRQVLFLLKDVSLSGSYQNQYQTEDRITNWYAFETNYGFPIQGSMLALRTTTKHTLSFQLAWNILDLKEISFFGLKLNLRGSTLQNTEQLSLSWGETLYDKAIFSPFVEPIYEISYDHSSRYQLTDYITGTFIIKLLNNQYQEVVVINGRRVDRPFQMSWGLYIAFDLGIKF